MSTGWDEGGGGVEGRCSTESGEECKTAFSHCQTPNDDTGLMTRRPVTPSHYSPTILLCHNLHAVIGAGALANSKITSPCTLWHNPSQQSLPRFAKVVPPTLANVWKLWVCMIFKCRWHSGGGCWVIAGVVVCDAVMDWTLIPLCKHGWQTTTCLIKTEYFQLGHTFCRASALSSLTQVSVVTPCCFGSLCCLIISRCAVRWSPVSPGKIVNHLSLETCQHL